MTENKRFRLGYVCGDYGLIDNDDWIDLHSMSENSEKNVRICIHKMNQLADENEQLKQFPIKLDNRIQKLEEDLKALKEMETDDLNPQAIEDVAIVIGMSLNALKEFKKELKGDVE